MTKLNLKKKKPTDDNKLVSVYKIIYEYLIKFSCVFLWLLQPGIRQTLLADRNFGC